MKLATVALLLALSAAPGPEAAQKKFVRDVEGWKIGGVSGDCSASLGAGSAAILLVSPDPKGSHAGAIGLRDTDWTVEDGDTTVKLMGTGSWARYWSAIGYAKSKTYWMPLTSPAELDEFPNVFVLHAYEKDRQQARFWVTSFKVAVETLRQCVSETRIF